MAGPACAVTVQLHADFLAHLAHPLPDARLNCDIVHCVACLLRADACLASECSLSSCSDAGGTSDWDTASDRENHMDLGPMCPPPSMRLRDFYALEAATTAGSPSRAADAPAIAAHAVIELPCPAQSPQAALPCAAAHGPCYLTDDSADEVTITRSAEQHTPITLPSQPSSACPACVRDFEADSADEVVITPLVLPPPWPVSALVPVADTSPAACAEESADEVPITRPVRPPCGGRGLCP